MRSHLYGEGAVYVDLELEDDPQRAARTLAAATHLRARLPLADVVIGAGVVVIAGVGPWDGLDALVAEAARVAAAAPVEPDGEIVTLPVVYDGIDLDDVARASGLDRDAVIALHAGTLYRAELIGFLPGFAYLGGVDARLALPRRATPRPRVPAGSVAIAGGFSGVYPFTSPGGWHLLGRTDVAMFDLARTPPSLISPGARVRFVPVGATISPPLDRARDDLVGRGVRIERAPAIATVQDGGRAGRLSAGLPPSGPLDPVAHVASNFAVGNDAGEAAIEVPLGTLELRAVGAHRVSIDGAPSFALADGATLVVASEGRAVRYVAFAGGVATPLQLGARATFLSAALGGFRGRALRRGDVIPTGVDPARAAIRGLAPPDRPASPALLLVELGPHLDRFPEGAVDALVDGDFRVSRLGDRVGVRLEGARLPLPRPLRLPVPMVRGAIEVTPDGTPIVLGPDHPTTGGYAVIAVLRRGSQALLARCAPGHAVRFVVA